MGTTGRLTRRALAFVSVAAIAGGGAAACGEAPQPIEASQPVMAGVNHTDRIAYIRLVSNGDTFRDFLLPPNRAVLLSTDFEVDRAVTFDAACKEVGTAVFGAPQVSFSVGGQIFLGPKNVSGMTLDQLQPPPRLPASPTDACASIPTPRDPRDRVQIGGGGGVGTPP